MRRDLPQHWAANYIGEPWVAGDNDCWSFARKVWRDNLGINVPVIAVDTENMLMVAQAFRDHAERVNWFEVDPPIEGDAVLMAHWRHPSHVGIWLDADGGGVLHCEKGPGVIFQTRAALARAGWAALRYYRRAVSA